MPIENLKSPDTTFKFEQLPIASLLDSAAGMAPPGKSDYANLPMITIQTDTSSQPPQPAPQAGFFGKTERVMHDIGGGIKDELVHHPGQVLEKLALGALTGASMALLSPAAVGGLAIGSIAGGSVYLLTHSRKFFHAADVVANPTEFSTPEQLEAHRTLFNFGRSTVDVGALLAGNGAGVNGFYAGRIALRTILLR